MTLIGLSEKGFKIKKINDIKSDLEDELRRKVDQNLNFDASSIVGNLTAIVANQAAQVWESLASLYHALQPDTAEGLSLDALCSLTGTYRKRGDYSQAEVLIFLKGNTKIPQGHAIKTIGGHVFKLDKEIDNPLATDAKIIATVTAQEKGYILAHTDTEAEIMNPVQGWEKATFTKTTHIGQLDETDQELRKRRISELKANGVSTTDAMKSRLLEIPDVDGVYIAESGHSFQVYVAGGNEEKIAQTIWECRPVGIETLGDETKFIDSEFVFFKKEKEDENLPKDKTNAPSVSFSRPKDLALVLSAEVRIRSKVSKDEPDKSKKEEEIADIKRTLTDSLAKFATKHFKMGREVYNARFYSTILAHGQVLDVTKLEIKCRDGSVLPHKIRPEQIASLKLNDILILCSEASS